MVLVYTDLQSGPVLRRRGEPDICMQLVHAAVPLGLEESDAVDADGGFVQSAPGHGLQRRAVGEELSRRICIQLCLLRKDKKYIPAKREE
jgi:hypothetical protein